MQNKKKTSHGAMRFVVAAAVVFGGMNYLVKSAIISTARKCKKCLSRKRN